MSEVAMVILSAVVGALAGIVTTAWKSRKDLEAQYDIDLRKRRIEAYAELWKTLEPLAYHFPAQDELDGRAVTQLGAALRRWYYATGGLVLSADSRPAYFNLQAALEGTAAADLVSRDDKKILKALASRLRTSTTEDVATRVRARLGPSVAARLSPALHRVRRPVAIVVDHRWAWDENRRQAVFVIVRNLTARPLVVDSVHVASQPAEGVPRVLQRDEQHEFTVPIGDGVSIPVAAPATVILRGGRAIRGRAGPGVPLPSDLVAPSTKAAISGKS